MRLFAFGCGGSRSALNGRQSMSSCEFPKELARTQNGADATLNLRVLGSIPRRLTTHSKLLRAFTLVGRSHLRLRGGCGRLRRIQPIDFPVRRARQPSNASYRP